ncbi:uncharacterized protein LOC114965397 isoform X2 [Acropora millepora]|uniref:uncharacterized protein LOC114965397 isoform X2 n=1 Tax=Acropora millepora TaxID=45264 RepID=UPI001CF59C17|nr:uncharacterized protein LOC114965397 isoform X2 [Acropora millepora]
MTGSPKLLVCQRRRSAITSVYLHRGMARLNFGVFCWHLWLARASFTTAATQCSDTSILPPCWIIDCQGSYAAKYCRSTCNLCPSGATGQESTDSDTHTTASPTTSPRPRCLGQTLELPVSRGLVKDKILQGHVIWTQTVLSELQCEDSCLRLPSCLAYNYNCSRGVRPKKCELLNSVTDVTNFPGFCFRPFERTKVRNELLGSQCLDNPRAGFTRPGHHP